MFGSGKSRNNKIDTLVGRNTEVTGDVRFEGGLHVDGVIKGNVLADPDSTSVISVSEHGRIEGEVRVPHIALNGTVAGDVYASERVELGASARVNGNVFYNLIEMAIGAEVNGKLEHRPANQPKLLRHDNEVGEGGSSSDGQRKAS